MEVVARQHQLPIGAHRKEELERRSSMDIRHPQWSALVITPDNVSWPTPGPVTLERLGRAAPGARGQGRPSSHSVTKREVRFGLRLVAMSSPMRPFAHHRWIAVLGLVFVG